MSPSPQLSSPIGLAGVLLSNSCHSPHHSHRALHSLACLIPNTLLAEKPPLGDAASLVARVRWDLRGQPLGCSASTLPSEGEVLLRDPLRYVVPYRGVCDCLQFMAIHSLFKCLFIVHGYQVGPLLIRGGASGIDETWLGGCGANHQRDVRVLGSCGPCAAYEGCA